jgi:hypothetical protein
MESMRSSTVPRSVSPVSQHSSDQTYGSKIHVSSDTSRRQTTERGPRSRRLHRNPARIAPVSPLDLCIEEALLGHNEELVVVVVSMTSEDGV